MPSKSSGPRKDFSVVLPGEVTARIVAFIGEVASSEPGYKRDLASCALTCRSWLAYLRPYLFASLTLRSYVDVEELLRILCGDVKLREKVVHLDLQEKDERWIHRLLRLLPSQLPAVTSLRLYSNLPVDISDRSDDTLLALSASLPQIRDLELGGSAFDDFPTISACVSAFPSLLRAQSHGITWTRLPYASEPSESLVQVNAVGGDIPWLWAVSDPFGVEERPVLADADAAVLKRLLNVGMYNSSSCTCSLMAHQGSDGPRWELIARYPTRNSVSISIETSSLESKGVSTIRAATLRLTPAGSTVSNSCPAWTRRMAELDLSYHSLPYTAPLILDWEYVGTVEWYVNQALKNTLLRRLWAAKRLVCHLSKGVEPPRAHYLPMALRYH